jgi:polyisoprenoid-binding protein YceI
MGSLMSKNGCVLLLACLVLSLSSPGAVAAEYQLRPEQSELVVLVFKTGFASALAHDHVVRATRFSGTISGDPSNPVSAVVRVTVPVEGLAADEPEVRRQHGLATTLDEADRREIQMTMLGEAQLHAAAYPDIGFRSVAVEPRAPTEYLLTGDFTLHGATRRISFPVRAHLAGDVLRATGSFEFNQSDFGITPLSRFLGAVRNQDRVRILFDLVATP